MASGLAVFEETGLGRGVPLAKLFPDDGREFLELLDRRDRNASRHIDEILESPRDPKSVVLESRGVHRIRFQFLGPRDFRKRFSSQR